MNAMISLGLFLTAIAGVHATSTLPRPLLTRATFHTFTTIESIFEHYRPHEFRQLKQDVQAIRHDDCQEQPHPFIIDMDDLRFEDQRHDLEGQEASSSRRSLLKICFALQYLEELLSTILRSESDLSDQLPTIVVDRLEKFHYQDFYEHYALEKKAAIFQQQDVLSSTNDSGHDESFTHVPFPLVNDYFQRLPVGMKKPDGLYQPPSKKHWRVCPAGLHMVLYYPPSSSDQDDDSPLAFELMTRQAWLMMMMMHNDLEKHWTPAELAQVLALDQLDLDSFTSARSSASRESTSRPKSFLQSGDVLFVPHDHLMHTHENENDDSPPRLHQFCYVDASNLNVYRQALVSQHVFHHSSFSSTSSRRRDPLDFAPTMFHSMFPTDMNRRPETKDFQLEEVLTWPKKERPRVTSGASRRARFRVWQDDARWNYARAQETLPVPFPPVVVVEAEAEAVPSEDPRATTTRVGLWCPEFHGPGFDHLASKDDDDDDDDAHDEDGTEDHRGYLVSVYTFEERVRTWSHNLSVPMHQWQRNALAMPSVRFGTRFDGYDFHVTIQSLVPDTFYCFTLRLVLGSRLGPESQCSPKVMTRPAFKVFHDVPVQVPGLPIVVHHELVQLKWKSPPLENKTPGLATITAYEILLHPSSSPASTTHDDVTFRAEDQVVILHHSTSCTALALADMELLPFRSYQFQIAAVNDVGRGPWSAKSDIWTPPRSDDVAHGSGGGGATMIVRGKTSSTLHEARKLPHLTGTVSDRKQELAIVDSNDTSIAAIMALSLWTGHFSPQAYDVAAGTWYCRCLNPRHVQDTSGMS